MRHALALALCSVAAPLGAHPHIFVDTGLEIILDDRNRVTHIRVTWEYDELYSLLITEDLGVDDDYDGVLSPSDREALTGFDANWIEGYNGDLVATLGGEPLSLSGPMEPTAELTDGKIVTTHLRAVEGAPQLRAPLVLKPFDATYYTAYEVGRPVTVTGQAACDIDLDPPDMEAALAMTEDDLAQIPEDPERAEAMGFGDIGERFATEVRVTCATS
ncbi:DUF1007 family protein [Sulfitobacter sp. HNIBRBA3233]|uniref:DUF1007 family protein n=1 Tax=Sulfitobacter marinivivus TaxID=3158558 RepID=UPI0032DF772B